VCDIESRALWLSKENVNLRSGVSAFLGLEVRRCFHSVDVIEEGG
jgi:hypothetical protein